jgi:hypothetical protein
LGICAHIRAHRTAADRFLDLRCGGRDARPLAIGGGYDLPLGIQELEFNIVLILKCLGIGDALLVILAVILIEVIRKVFRSVPGAVANIGLHGGIIVSGKSGSYRVVAEIPLKEKASP